MYKIIAVDLDETLLNDDRTISIENKEAIRKAKQQGVKIVPCSGRSPGFLNGIYDDLELMEDNEYSILANGAIVLEHNTNKIISCSPLAFEKAKQLFHFGLSRDLCVQVFTPFKVYVFNIDDEEKERILSFGNQLEFRDDQEIDFLKDNTIIKVLFVRNDIQYLYSLESELLPITSNSITVSFSSSRYLELNAYGVHKGIGLKALADYLDITMNHTIGIGDNFNDLGLVKDAGIGIAVANAIHEVKAIADVVLDKTNNEAAVASVIERYVLCEK